MSTQFDALGERLSASRALDDVLDSVVQGDCLDVLASLPDDCVDAVVADPPYNLSQDDGLVEDHKNWTQTDEMWDKYEWAEYEAFTNRWLSEAARVLKPDGALWTWGSYHNIGFVHVGYERVGVEKLNEIVWFKRNAMPNLTQSRFTASHETVLWGTPRADGEHGESGEYTFNYDETREWPCESSPISESDKQVRSVWNVPTNKSQPEQEFDHPTQKPLRLLERIVRASTNEGDVVLDPFAGSGATLVAANLNDRGYVGIEREAEYVEMAREYLASVTEKPDSVAAETGYE